MTFLHAITFKTHELEYFSYQLPDDWIKKPADKGGFYHFGTRRGSTAGGYVYAIESEIKETIEDKGHFAFSLDRRCPPC